MKNIKNANKIITILAFLVLGSLKFGTELLTDSNPVKAEHPEENARKTRNIDKLSVACKGAENTGSG